MGERSAVRPKSEQSVSQSDPGLRRPTPPLTAGRKPAARPPRSHEEGTYDLKSREAGLAQPKIGQGAGQSPAVSARREALASSLNLLILNTPLSHVLDKIPNQILLSFSRRSIAGIGRHMAIRPCSPLPVSSHRPFSFSRHICARYPFHSYVLLHNRLSGGFHAISVPCASP